MIYAIVFSLLAIIILLNCFINCFKFNAKRISLLTGIRFIGTIIIYTIGMFEYFKGNYGFIILGLMVLLFFFVESFIHIKRQ